MTTTSMIRAEVIDAVDALSQSRAGRAALTSVKALLDGPLLDSHNQQHVTTLLEAAYFADLGMVLGVMRAK